MPVKTARASEAEAYRRAIAAEYPALYLALYHHRTHENKRFGFHHYEYTRAMLMDKAQHIVLKKSTQGAATEVCLCKEFAWMDRGLKIIHVLPDENIKSRFVRNRFDQSIAHTPYYRQRLKSEETRQFGIRNSFSVNLKHWSKGVISIIGSHAIAGFGEFPADVKVIDEYNNCEMANLPMAQERLSNSDYRIELDISQPTIQGVGISKIYADSDQKRWYLRCEHCGKWIRPTWVGNVVRKTGDNEYEIIDPDWDGYMGADARLICNHCGRPEDRFSPGEWVQENARSIVSGYHLGKLVSTKMSMNEMVKRFDDGLADPTVAARFWNGDMGEDYTAPGAKLQEEDLDKLIQEYNLPQGSTQPCFAGIDVGNVLHVVIGEMVDRQRTRLVYIGTVACETDLEELDLVLRRFNVRCGVIDELPERRLSRRLAYKHRNWWMCRYAAGKRDIPDPRSKIVSVDRTSSLDAVNEQVVLGTMEFPRNARNLEGFYPQLTELTRAYEKNANGGEGAYVWVGGGADHYFHALAYMCLARRMVLRK